MASLLALLFDAPEQICGDDGVFAPLTVFKDRLAVLRSELSKVTQHIVFCILRQMNVSIMPLTSETRTQETG